MRRTRRSLTQVSRNFVALPKSSNGYVAEVRWNLVLGYDGSASWGSPGTMVHELNHVLDFTVLNTESSSFSWSDAFLAAFDADPYRATTYQKDSPSEQFAELGRLSFLERM